MTQDASKRKRKKQPTRPKVRGCYNCSQRRVSCDRATPQCAKCVGRGLQCSGLGPRYRFADGIASRGKFKGRSAPCANEPCRDGDDHEPGFNVQDSVDGIVERAQPALPAEKPQKLASNALLRETALVEMGSQLLLSSSSVPYSLDHMSGQDRYFLKLFAERVAPVMVCINNGFNGYRDYILPMAETFPIIRDAALAAGAGHAYVQHKSLLQQARVYYTAAIRGLVECSKRAHQSRETATASVGAVLLLVITDMVCAGSDFQLLFPVLKRLLELSGGAHARDDAGSFMEQQIRKICFYAEPFLDEATGAQLVRTGAQGAFESFYTQLRWSPEHTAAIARVIELIEIARDIYVQRALDTTSENLCFGSSSSFSTTDTATTTSSRISALVDKFVADARDVPVAGPGGHSLVWAYFIVAAESTQQAHREMLVGRLRQLFVVTGFANAMVAVQQLERIWEIGGRQRWTYMLPQLARTFVM